MKGVHCQTSTPTTDHKGCLETNSNGSRPNWPVNQLIMPKDASNI